MQMKRVASQEPGTGAAAATRRWQRENWGGMGRAPFSQFPPQSAPAAPSTPAQAPARSALSGHGWEHHGTRTAVFKARESGVGSGCPSPGCFRHRPCPWDGFTAGAREGARHRRGHSRLEVGRAPPSPPRTRSLPCPQIPSSSVPAPPSLPSPALLPLLFTPALLPCIYPRVIYFFPWQLYSPFPCLTAIK